MKGAAADGDRTLLPPPTPTPTPARPPGRRYDLIRENAFGFEANFTVVGQAINANKTGTCRDTCQSAPLETMTHALQGRCGEGEVGGTRDERRTSFTSVAAQRENHLHRPASRRSDTAASRFKDSKIIGGVASHGGEMSPTNQDQKATSRKATRTSSCSSYAEARYARGRKRHAGPAALAADLTSQPNDQSPAFRTREGASQREREREKKQTSTPASSRPSRASGSASLARHQTPVMRAIGRRCVQEVRGVKRL